MCALFSPEILQVGVVKGLKEEYKLSLLGVQQKIP